MVGDKLRKLTASISASFLFCGLVICCGCSSRAYENSLTLNQARAAAQKVKASEELSRQEATKAQLVAKELREVTESIHLVCQSMPQFSANESKKFRGIRVEKHR